MPCNHALQSCLAIMPCNHALQSCLTIMPCNHALQSCFAIMPCNHAANSNSKHIFNILHLRAQSFSKQHSFLRRAGMYSLFISFLLSFLLFKNNLFLILFGATVCSPPNPNMDVVYKIQREVLLQLKPMTLPQPCKIFEYSPCRGRLLLVK